jgi:uncharacterized protein DUF6542
MIAVTATAIGFAFDAGGGRDLTHVFAALYMVGCIAAVLLVRQSGIFTAVVQPPMILFVSVPGAYFLFHGAKLAGFKDIVINCVYPLIERFPLMVFTSGAVLLIGLVRWFVGSRSTADKDPASVSAKIGGNHSRSHDRSHDGEEEPAVTRRHAVDRPRAARPPHPATAANRREDSGPPRPRRPRAPLIGNDPPPDRSRRRPPPSWQPEDPVELPRHRAPAGRAPRSPYDRREPYERRPAHDRRSRHNSYDDSYDQFEAYEAQPHRRPGPNGSAVTNGTHHPISRVRYRGTPADTDTRQERPVRSRSRSSEAEGWEYDI